ncbi:phospholipase A2 inhibitor 31 kDa subunit-like [Anomaloglossus baeobatrachus]|uniref:phospholipase A2 inhibitor 31 kDa subunit-like n=1 Tax=Anomaloglossus baeobatrachus TaxID=238106 RepID=UPI003F50AA55
MKNLVALLCVISALVGSVFSNKCHLCWSHNSTTCNVTETECLGDRCMTASQYFNADKTVFKSIYKGCANDTLCETKGSGMVEKLNFRFYAHCCTGDLCNNQTYQLHEEDLTPNGKICPTALCLDTLEECETDKKMNCTGSMDRCLEYRAKLRNPDDTVVEYSVKGCVNSDCCNYNFDSIVGFKVLHRELLKC